MVFRGVVMLMGSERWLTHGAPGVDALVSTELGKAASLHDALCVVGATLVVQG